MLGYGRLKVRIVEAWVSVTWDDGTTTREQWRLVTSLPDHRRYPAADLVELYHRRWQVETTYYSIKESVLLPHLPVVAVPVRGPLLLEVQRLVDRHAGAVDDVGRAAVAQWFDRLRSAIAAVPAL